MQEVWRGRLPRLGVVNSIGRKKYETMKLFFLVAGAGRFFALYVLLVLQIGLLELVKYLAASLRGVVLSVC